MEHIKIGPMTFSVAEVTDLRDGDRKLNGWIKLNELEVLLEESMADDVKIVTLWHEVIHALLEQAGFDGNEEHDERVLDALAYGLHQVLMDNPDVVGLYR